jgi:hypothetical protein
MQYERNRSFESLSSKAAWFGAAAAISLSMMDGHVWAQSMSVPGKFDVSATGAAVYSIPIAVPAGTASMAPTLSFDYSSQSSNGILGIGWSLGGLASITRCPQTFAQDGIRGSVYFDSNDRFCLDGQRLVAINNGTYGADGTEYRTEIESFTRVISHGTAGNGPAWFEVRTKSGQTMEFGHTADSQQLVQGGATVRNWALDKVSDTKGNYFSITYTFDATNGQSYPIGIDYTGNSAANLTPYNKVQFIYEARPDSLYSSVSSTTQIVAKRLSKVQTYTGNNLISDYRLKYDANGAGGASRLTSVLACGADGICLPATTFTWQGPTVSLQNWEWPASLGGHSTCSTEWQFANLFGDGRQVFWTVCSDGAHHATRLNPNGTLQNFDWTGGVHGSLWPTWGMGDLFGEGRQIFWTTDNTGSHFATRLNADGTLQNFTWTGGTSSFPSTGGQWGLFDLFGDGRQEFFAFDNNGNYVATRFNPDGTLQNWSWSGGPKLGSTPGWPWQFGDLFGDGRQEFWTSDNNGNHFAVRFNSNGTLQQWSWSGGAKTFVNTDHQYQLGNIFGDGRQVFWAFGNDGTHVATRFNPDGTIQNFTWIGGRGPGNGGWALRDVFGNGQQVYWTYNTDGTQIVTRLNPDGTFQNLSWAGGHGPGNSGWGVADAFGDGRTLLWTFNPDGSHVATRMAAPDPDALKTITTGLGATTTVTYQPLTKTGVYTKDANGVYPIQDVQTPFYVVSQLDTSNGVGGTQSATYAYAGAKSDLSGRGFLGFRQMTATDLQTNIVQTTNFQQNFPFGGLTVSSLKKLGTVTLNQSTSTYQFSNASGAANGKPSATGLFQIFRFFRCQHFCCDRI